MHSKKSPSPETVRTLLNRVDLGQADAELRRNETRYLLSDFVSKDVSDIWVDALNVFVKERPLKYWDKETVEKALEVLEKDIPRSLESISAWESQLSVCLFNIFQKTKLSLNEESLNLKKYDDIVAISAEFHPEYLRLIEHIFGNLICIYWGILRRKGVKANFGLVAGEKFFKEKSLSQFYCGYNERVRNAIAHGEIHYRAIGVVYGNPALKYELSSREFLTTLDTLTRTTNSLALAVFLFGARNEKLIAKSNRFSWPLGLISRLMIGGIARGSFTIEGVFESEYPRTGPQLHFGIKTNIRKREVLIIDCLKISSLAITLGLNKFKRFIFEINCGKDVDSMMIVDAEKFRSHCEKDAPIEKLADCIENSFMWNDESKWSMRLKVWKGLVGSQYNLQKNNFQKQLADIYNHKHLEYEIRNIEKQATEELFRIKITAALTTAKEINQESVKETVKDIVKRYKTKIQFTNPDSITKKRLAPGRPSYIWVYLHRRDGAKRWLTGNQGLGGNCICIAEWKKGDLTPIVVENPELVEDAIRFRFSPDPEAVEKAIKSLIELERQLSE